MRKKLTRIFWGDRLEWNLKAPPDQVLAQIEQINQGTWIKHLLVPILSVIMRKNRFSASKMAMNLFTHALFGEVYETTTGTRVVARFRMSIPMIIFWLMWLGIAFVGGIVELFKALRYSIDARSLGFQGVLFLLFCCFPFVFGLLFLLRCRRSAESNENDIREVLNLKLGSPQRSSNYSKQ